MRKYLISALTVILIAVLIFIVGFGANISNLKILSYKQMGDNSKKLTLHAKEYKSMNENDVKAKEKELLSKIETYDAKKVEYEQLLAEKRAANADIANILDIDFLLVKVGNYASDYGIDLIFDITKNAADGNAKEYILTDLNFEITGEYITIADYVSSLENDVKLDFEIRDFKIWGIGEGSTSSTKKNTTIDKANQNAQASSGATAQPEGTGNLVKATFKVYGIGISRETLTEPTTAEESTNTTNTINTNNTKQ